MCRTTFAVILAALALVMVGGAPEALASRPYAIPSPVAAGGGLVHEAPAVFDQSQVAWQQSGGGDWDIGVQYGDYPVVVPGPGSDQCHPAITEAYVVFEDNSAGNWDIASYYLLGAVSGATPAPTVTPLTTDPADQLDPAVSADGVVVYEDHSRGNWDISTVYIGSGAPRHLTTNRSAQVDPAIDGNNVVWADHRNGNWDIYLYNFKTNTTKRLTTNKADQTAPQTGGGMVFYQDHRNGNWDIYAYSLKTGKERRLTTDKHDQTAPQIGTGNTHFIVYQDGRSGTPHLWLCDLKTHINKPVTDGPGSQTSAAVSWDTVVWCDQQAPAEDVYSTKMAWPAIRLQPVKPVIGYNSTATFDGAFSLYPGPVAGTKLTIAGHGTRTMTVEATSDPNEGVFTPTYANVKHKITIHAFYPGDADHLPALSKSATIKPRALLTRPKIVRYVPPPSGWPTYIPLLSDDVVISGYLKPHHGAGTKAISIELYKHAVSGVQWTYVLKRTVRVAVSDYASYSKYRVRLTLAKGKWKAVAVHADADHAWTVSRPSAVWQVGFGY